MEFFTLDREYVKQDVIDQFKSAIWTERYYGDSDVELIVPTTLENLQMLANGTFLGCIGSDELMILETQDLQEDGTTKVTGISLLKWLNNRFVRTSPNHEDRYWNLSGLTAGRTLTYIVQNMCIGGPYLDGTINTGIVNAFLLPIPGLGIGDYDHSGFAITVGVPFGPVYNALLEIATTYELGMQIVRDTDPNSPYSLLFRDYKGVDRSSNQHIHPPVRFSPGMDSLTGIKELRSISAYKTRVWSFAPANPGGLATTPGEDGIFSLEGTPVGFDMRAEMIFAEDITTDQVEGNAVVLLDILNSRAKDALANAAMLQIVDGQVVPDVEFKYGTDYNLGDIVEVQGNSGVVSKARVTEYIRTQDESGKKSYPTLTTR